MSLNINNDKNDSSYRYKMPTIDIHQTGKGNGCFTKLINLRKISESLNYPPNILLKFIGIYLGCNVNSKNNIINGHHKNTEIQSIIFEFINNYSIIWFQSLLIRKTLKLYPTIVKWKVLWLSNL